MLDIGWSEMAVIALVALIIIGPKDLPKVMRSASHWVRKARGLAREFQSGVDDMIREADLEDARKAVESARSLDVRKAVDDTIDPTGGMRDEVREIEDAARDRGNDKAPSDGPEKPKVDSKSNEKDAETEPAKVGTQPHIAPPHSLSPPAAQGATASTDTGSQATADTNSKSGTRAS